MDAWIAVAAVALVAWFAAGTIYNVRKASALMRWLQDGLPALAPRTTVRWLGSSAVHMTLLDPRRPFATASFVFFLEPRDLPWWPLSRMRGRRDTLIFRCAFGGPPAIELEALDPASWSARDARPRLPAGWSTHRDGAIEIHHADAAALVVAQRLAGMARDAGLELRRLSIRAADPHFQAHVGWPDASRPASDLVATLQRFAAAALEGHERST